jgi:hypothetical protein
VDNITRYIKDPRRHRYNVQKALIDALGGYKAIAAACLCQPGYVQKWGEDPDGKSGQDITVRHLQTLLALAGERLDNLAAQNAADELIQDHFLSLFHRRAYPEEKVFQFIEMLAGQRLNPKQAVNE